MNAVKIFLMAALLIAITMAAAVATTAASLELRRYHRTVRSHGPPR